jgi:NADPH:quinone reductase
MRLGQLYYITKWGVEGIRERYIGLMGAIVYDIFGDPDVLHLREVALPEPGHGQVRVAIYAAGTNPVDAQNRQDGSWAGLHPPVIPGCDASGVIDVVGAGVTHFAPGDEVFYMVDFLNNSRGTDDCGV